MQELYVVEYDKINWPAQRNNCAAVDLYAPHTMLHDVAFSVLSVYEKYPIFRESAQRLALEHIKREDLNTDYADLGPVNKAMNMLVVWMTEGPDSYSFKRHLERNLDFMWMANDGMRMNGTNGSQLWDTAFVCQAMVESGLAKEPEFHDSMKHAHSFIDSMQVWHFILILASTRSRMTWLSTKSTIDMCLKGPGPFLHEPSHTPYQIPQPRDLKPLSCSKQS